MSSLALQRVIVRMLYDPALVQGVLADAPRTLAGLDLTADERRWLTDTDPRAWRTDPYRRSRSLQSLLEEFPVASGWVVRATDGVPTLDRFFSSPGFHAGMQAGQSLAGLYAGYLPGVVPDVAPYAELEHALARTRRPHPDRRDSQWRLAPHVELAQVRAGTLSHYRRVRDVLTERSDLSLDRVIDHNLALPAGGLKDGSEAFLIRDQPDGVEMETLSDELYQILRLADRGCSKPELSQRCVELGAEPDDVEDILKGFVETGELLPPIEPA